MPGGIGIVSGKGATVRNPGERGTRVAEGLRPSSSRSHDSAETSFDNDYNVSRCDGGAGSAALEKGSDWRRGNPRPSVNAGPGFNFSN